MEIAISPVLLQMIRAEADASPGHEICGLLFGTDHRIEALQKVTNVARRTEDTFELDPAALIAAHRAQRAGGARIIGCYHSHPNGRADPSDRDRDAAEPGSLWLIVGTTIKVWRRTRDAFIQLKLIQL
jgi:desampylase